MKVESISIRNFKRFDHLDLSFKNHTLNEVSDRFLILGDNGSGKTTLMQAVALPLVLATRQRKEIASFDWTGFVSGRYARWGRPTIELEVSFTADEIAATQEVASAWNEARSDDARERQPFVEPGNQTAVRLTLDGERCRAGSHPEFLQFQGRHYAYQLLQTDPLSRRYFARLPGFFWFDQFRNLGSTLYPTANNGDGRSGVEEHDSYEFGVARLREYLNGWQLARSSKSQPYTVNYLMQLENYYKRIFPGRSFAGVEPMPDFEVAAPKDYYFLLNDGHREYDIVEMSAGEQSVFPILYQFVRQQIAYSVVLIDEVDLNLHPPIAQQFVTQLNRIAPTCQFILTTHSEAVSAIIGQDETFRLPGGTLCL